MLIDFFHSLSFKAHISLSRLFKIKCVCLYPRFRVDIDVLVLLCIYTPEGDCSALDIQ
jgi:hypothetical protein